MYREYSSALTPETGLPEDPRAYLTELLALSNDTEKSCFVISFAIARLSVMPFAMHSLITFSVKIIQRDVS